jgi:hypothetical protein
MIDRPPPYLAARKTRRAFLSLVDPNDPGV